MRRVASIILAGLLAAVAVRAETPAKEEPKPKERATRQLEPRSQNPAWLAAIERLRAAPQAGEIINVGITAGLADVFELKDEDKARLAALQDAYATELLQKEAKWEEDMKALRADYESKMIALLPEARREPAKKLLDFSHASWLAACEWDAKFNREFLARAKEQPKATSAEEQKENKRVMQAWMKERTEKRKKEELAVLQTLRENLSAEEAARLEQFDRNRAVEPAPEAPKAPQPDKK